MRQILFQGKRIDNSEWVEGDLVVNKPTQTHRIFTNFSNVKHGDHTDDGLHIDGGGLFIVDPKSVGQYSGFNTCKQDKIFENTIVFQEEETESGDERTYLICRYIEEWGMFALLTYGEMIKYEDLGADSLDEESFWTYNLQKSQEYHYAGEYFDYPNLIKR